MKVAAATPSYPLKKSMTKAKSMLEHQQSKHNNCDN